MIRTVIIFLLLWLPFFSVVYSQTTDENFDPAARYDEIIESLEQEKDMTSEVKQTIPKDEIAVLLPNLSSPLYEGWIESTNPLIWDSEREERERESFLPFSEELLSEFKAKKVIRQTYKKDQNVVQITLYRFDNFAGAYSASTVLSEGNPAKLKVGKNVFESDNSLSFWKGDYYVELRSPITINPEVKGFTVLASQEISDKIQDTHQKPVIAIQLPALNRVPGVMKYCLGPICCQKYFLSRVLEVDPAYLGLNQSGGVIAADYKVSDNPADDRIVTLVLSRYESNEAAHLVFGEYMDFYKKKEASNEEVKIDVNDGVVRVKNNKDDYTFFKQQGNIFGVAYGSTDKKAGQKVLELVPWPVEITR